VLRHHGGDGRLDQRGGEARQDGRDAAEDVLVEDGALGEVGDLGGAADVGRGGQDGVLKDGAQQGVGAEALGCGVEDREEVGGGVGLCGGAGLPCAVGQAAQGLALAGWGSWGESMRKRSEEPGLTRTWAW
jgi:hypothetical protein